MVCLHGFRSLLSEDELRQLEEACDMALELNQSKHRIYEYVESRMSFIAPNLSIIVGASTAAKIMGETCKKKDLFLKFKSLNALSLSILNICRHHCRLLCGLQVSLVASLTSQRCPPVT